jgi:hypothetical protein
VSRKCERPENPRGISWTRQAVKQYDGKVVPGKDPMKRAIYWFSIKPLEGEGEGTDRWALGKNFVSITPLRLDLTDEKDLARVLAIDHAGANSPAKIVSKIDKAKFFSQLITDNRRATFPLASE